AKPAETPKGHAAPVEPTHTSPPHGDGNVNFTEEDPAKRRPTGLGLPATNVVTPPPTNVVVTPPPEKKPPTGVSGAEGPQDPYGGGGAGDPGDRAGPGQKAEAYPERAESQRA